MSDDKVGRIPMRFRARCEFCGEDDVDVREEGTHQFVKGWVKVRSGGGGHGISLATRENRWAHSWCIDRLTRGSLGQGRLL
jgi:hypothetical protein